MMIAISDWADKYQVVERATYTHSEVILARLGEQPTEIWAVFTRNLTKAKDVHIAVTYTTHEAAHRTWRDIVTLRNNIK